MARAGTGSDLIRARWEIRPRDGSEVIRGDLRALSGPSPEVAVVICHGFKGFREWGFFPSLARAVARRGHAAVTFDFSRNGVGDDGVDFSALDRFATHTHSRNLDEIGYVLDAVLGELLPRSPKKIALIGHSRGGAEAILAAGEDPRVQLLVTWAAIASAAGRWSSDQIAAWERGETVHILNARTRQEMPIGPGYWRDLIDNHGRLDVLGTASRLQIPWLIVHGEADETVPVSDAHTLFAAAGENAELCLIDGASHTFGATHPFGGPTPELSTAMQTTLSWLDRLVV
jgi:uncharacterized protein